jgi:ketosteroid isomerase-like protein
MKRIFVVSAALVFAMFLISCNDPAPNGNTTTNGNTNAKGNANSNSSTTTGANTESDVRKLLGELEAAISKNDVAALDKIYSDDYSFISTTGEMQTKAQRLDSMKSGDLKYESIKFEDAKIHTYGDAAVVTTRSVGKSTYKGKEQPAESMSTIVFAKTKDGWRVVHGHPSPIEAKK